MRTIEHWIGGRLATGTSTRTSPVFNPATGAQQAEVLLGCAVDVDTAVRSAADAFEAWSQSSLSQRTKVLFAFRQPAQGRRLRPGLHRRRRLLVPRADRRRGRHHAVQLGKRVQALGGAKNHAIVLPDADLDFASDHIVAPAFGSAGERCMAVSATVAVGSTGDALVDVVTKKAMQVRVGPGLETTSEMGPVVTAQARDRIVGLIGTGESQGARLTVDGRGYQVPGHERGFWVGPTVVDQVTTDMDLYCEEVFGPVLSVVRATTVDEAIELINANPYGNGTAIFTSSGQAARRFMRGVKVGMIGINVPVPVPMAYYSFGGWKDSLFGQSHIHGAEGVAFYTRGKVITSPWPHVEHDVGSSFHFPTSS